MNRREFLATGAALLAARTAEAASARIEILPDEPIGAINPAVYGQFTEHIGGVVYNGMWVGENSKIPNVHGLRKQLIEKVREMGVTVIRWPGGCFADSYNWRDGVGPRDRRPTRTNFWADTPLLKALPGGPQKYEPNQFGTNEFNEFCRLSGAQPYLAANVRSLTPFDFYEWVEYCNSPAGSTTLAKLRAEGGSPEPFNVRYWGVGNESWGCGGNFTGDEYAVEFRRFTEWVPKFDVPISFIASGPNVADYAWTHSFFQKVSEKGKGIFKNIYGSALHYYCGGAAKGKSTEFDVNGWYKQLSNANYMETLIRNHWQIMGETDTDHAVKLVVDEWGAWYESDPTIAPGYLWGYWPTLRDALVSALTLDIFHRHAEKVALASTAQMVNNINASFIAADEKFATTPNFEVFKMYAAHQGNTSVRTLFLALPVSNGVQLNGSCSIRDKKAVLTVVNPDVQNAAECEIAVRGAKPSNARAVVLTASDIHAHNTFENPHAVTAAESDVQVGAPFMHSFPAASVTRLTFDLS